MSQSCWAFARMWYGFWGIIALAIVANGLQHGWGEVHQAVTHMRPMGWVVLAAMFAPGPLAHVLSILTRRR